MGTADVFVLQSNLMTGGQIDDDENNTVTLTSNTNVDLQHDTNNACSGAAWDLQMVKIVGLTVNTGTAQFTTTGRSARRRLAAIDTSRSMLFYSWRDGAFGNDVCEREVRGQVASGTSVQFNRANGNNNGGCVDSGPLDIAWQRVQFPRAGRCSSSSPHHREQPGERHAAIPTTSTRRERWC